LNVYTNKTQSTFTYNNVNEVYLKYGYNKILIFAWAFIQQCSAITPIYQNNDVSLYFSRIWHFFVPTPTWVTENQSTANSF